MKVNDPNALGPSQGTGTSPAGLSKAGTAARTAPGQGIAPSRPGGDTFDGVQISDLVRNLRSLATESPERGAQVDNIARTYARGSYQVDAEATARGIVDDALKHS